MKFTTTTALLASALASLCHATPSYFMLVSNTTLNENTNLRAILQYPQSASMYGSNNPDAFWYDNGVVYKQQVGVADEEYNLTLSIKTDLYSFPSLVFTLDEPNTYWYFEDNILQGVYEDEPVVFYSALNVSTYGDEFGINDCIPMAGGTSTPLTEFHNLEDATIEVIGISAIEYPHYGTSS